MSIKKTLVAGMISAFLLGGSVGAEEIKSPGNKFLKKSSLGNFAKTEYSAKLDSEKTKFSVFRREQQKKSDSLKFSLEKRISEPKIKIIFNDKTESKQDKIDYLTSQTAFFREDELLERTSNTPKLNSAEQIEVENMLIDTKNKKINSYKEFAKKSKNLSENQKLVLLSAIGMLLKNYNGDLNLKENKIFPQDDFFYKMQDSLESGDKNGLGVCKHLSTHLEQLANDFGIKAATVSGISKNGRGHAYNILKLQDGTAIIDYGNILTTNTKNIEKTLQTYQKNNGTSVFQHLFFEDSKFKYEFLTKDGKHFLDLVEYDKSSEPLKVELLSDFKSESDLTIALNHGTFSKSIDLNYFGFFVKIGKIIGGLSSPLHKMSLFQAGFKRKFSIPKIIKIEPDISLIYGNLLQDKELKDKRVFGINNSFSIATNNKKGLNLSSRVNWNLFSTGDYPLFYDIKFGGGVSYKIPIKRVDIEPYFIMQFGIFPKDLGTCTHEPKLSELTIGTMFNIKAFKDINLSFDLYYLKKIWEQEFGGNAKFESKKFEINAGAYATKSNYEFCPDKYGVKVGLNLMLENLTIGANYKLEGTNYDGEIENQSSLEVRTSVRF